MKRDYFATRDAIVIACDAILLRAMPRLDPKIREQRFALNSALRDMVWKYSEETPIGRGKLGCAFWSKNAYDAYDAYRRTGTLREKLVFEHVYPRENVFKDLLKATNASQIRSILDELQTCTILEREHPLIEGKGFEPRPERPGRWWQRYKLHEGNVAIVKGPRFPTDDHKAFAPLNARWQIICSLSAPARIDSLPAN